MKTNKTNLLLRIITFPIKLLFSLLWFNLWAIKVSIQWVKNGGQELIYDNTHGRDLVRLIDQNEKIIKQFNKRK